MIKQFFEQLSEINWLLPWLVKIIILALVAIIAGVVLSIPAYFTERIIGPALERAIAALRQTCRWLFDLARATFGSRSDLVDRFVADHAQQYSFSRENAAIARRIARVQKRLAAIPGKIASLDATVSQAGTRITQSSYALSQMVYPETVPPPSPAEFQQIQLGKNRAVVKVILGTALCAAFVAINTGMLDQFFDSYFAGQRYFGIEIALVLAALFSIAELAFGGLFVFFKGMTPGNIAVKILLIALTLGLAGLEGAFYSKLGSDWTLFDALFAPNPAPAIFKLWLGIFGPILVGGLALTSHLLVQGIVELSESHIVRQWRRSLRLKARSAGLISERLSTAQKASAVLNTTMADLKSTFDSAEASTNSHAAVIEEGRAQFTAAIADAEAIRMSAARPLDRGAMLRLLSANVIIAVVAAILVVGVALLYTELGIASHSMHLNSVWLGWVIAIVEACGALVAGYAAMRENAIVSSADAVPTRNPAADWAGIAVAAVIMVMIAVANGYYAMQSATTTRMLWFAIAMLASFCFFFCGGRLGLIGASLGVIARVAARALSGVLVSLAGFFTGAVMLVLWAMREVLAWLAYPFRYLFLKDRAVMQFNPT
ncbi:MAG: hypothetical protein WDM91_04105 [Rhizomicrobium sp.]